MLILRTTETMAENKSLCELWNEFRGEVQIRGWDNIFWLRSGPPVASSRVSSLDRTLTLSDYISRNQEVLRKQYFNIFS